MKQISIAVDGVTVRARLLDDKAPRSAAALWQALPVTAELRHARRSGNAAYSPLTPLLGANLEVENQVSFCYPASICLLPQSGTLLWSYGQTQARTEHGNVWATHLGEVLGDPSEYFARLARTQSEGVTSITIERVES